ncbi:MAG: SAM-dependent methyltransferase [Deltaproteobacteria bacterium HGW-Deltaproteobacteria-14]|jgi:predicted TPR repeat methyltransferase|nr:MAG: SAM-dependent methyltransferase [Deltaproteobacteria bacterium HGW-Deltaproteobacteria-14]
MNEPVATALAEGDFEAALDACDVNTSRAVRALVLERLGRLDEALALCAAHLSAAPDDELALLVLCAVHSRRGERVSALEAAQRLMHEAPDRPVARQLVASLGGGSFAAPLRGEVVALFDAYADSFDAHLIELLGYRGHDAVIGALAALIAPRPTGVIVDLGCGTGLCGPGLRPLARRLVGVDLSPGMLAEARARGVYDALVEADLLYALATWPPATVDAFAAADVLGYVGELGGVFGEAARVLRPGGLFVFTVEATTAGPWRLGASRRVAYSEAYLREACATAGLTLSRRDAVTLRREDRVSVAAWLVTLTRAT